MTPTKPVRQHFGTLSTQTEDQTQQAILALGQVVLKLEKELGFPLRVSTTSVHQELLEVEVILPDAHYSHDYVMQVSRTLHDAVRPYGIDLDLIPDSDAPYAATPERGFLESENRQEGPCPLHAK